MQRPRHPPICERFGNPTGPVTEQDSSGRQRFKPMGRRPGRWGRRPWLRSRALAGLNPRGLYRFRRARWGLFRGPWP